MLKYNPKLKANSRQLRQNLTDSEIALWRRLQGKQLAGVQFYRQKPIGPYIDDLENQLYDFICAIIGKGKGIWVRFMKQTQEKAQKYNDQHLSAEDLEAIRQGKEDIKHGRSLTLEEYRSGKRL